MTEDFDDFMKTLAELVGGKIVNPQGHRNSSYVMISLPSKQKEDLQLKVGPDLRGADDETGCWRARVFLGDTFLLDQSQYSLIPNTCRDVYRLVV